MYIAAAATAAIQYQLSGLRLSRGSGHRPATSVAVVMLIYIVYSQITTCHLLGIHY